jgi:hypothetical protein
MIVSIFFIWFWVWFGVGKWSRLFVYSVDFDYDHFGIFFADYASDFGFAFSRNACSEGLCRAVFVNVFHAYFGGAASVIIKNAIITGLCAAGERCSDSYGYD